MRSENRADRIAGEHLAVLFAVSIVLPIGKPDKRIGPTYRPAVFDAVETRSSEARLAGKNINAVAAKSFPDPLAVKQDRLGLAGVEHYGKDRRRKCCQMHTRELRQRSG